MDLTEWVIVFDLDDTLISERDYQYSGLCAVENMIERVYNIKTNNIFSNGENNGIKDHWSYACEKLSLPRKCKQEMLWTYRLHQPNLCLQKGINDLIKNIKLMNGKLAIITDGRSFTQRLKINSVGLSDIPFFISDEHGEEKPDILRFKKVESKWPNSNYIYIGDNPEKDFIAPQQLNWLCLGARWVSDPIHSNTKSGVQPLKWFSNPNEVLNYIEQYIKNKKV